MTYYYIHDESGCALMSDEPPATVLPREPYVELADRDQYLRACAVYQQPVEPHPDPCLETQRRIRVAVAAWAYEVHADPLMSDAEFDALARSIDVNRSTANSDMDRWFLANFNPDTGIWVRRHPDTGGLERVYRMLRGDMGLRMTETTLQVWMVAP